MRNNSTKKPPSKIFKPKSATWMEIDLTKLKQNYKSIVRRVGKNIGIISIVKSNAYGHGLVPMAKYLSDLGTEKIGVASVDEVLELRRSSVMTPLLLLYPSLRSDFKRLIEYNTEITIDNYDDALDLDRAAKVDGKIVKVHVQVDTGLNRYGVKPSMAPGLIKKISELKNLFIEGVWTHYADAENDKSFSQKQFEVFMNVIKEVSQFKIDIPFVHIANSAAICNLPMSYDVNKLKMFLPNTRFLVRPGCLLYGTYAIDKEILDTKPIIDCLKTTVVSVSSIEKNESVGYFRKLISSTKMSIATLPVGWGNAGYNSLPTIVLSEGTYINGVGLISSNNLAVDITRCPTIHVNSVVYLIKNGDKLLNIDAVARRHNMFTNQFIAMIGPKVQKIYLKNS